LVGKFKSLIKGLLSFDYSHGLTDLAYADISDDGYLPAPMDFRTASIPPVGR
jgi:hypothetical protein